MATFEMVYIDRTVADHPQAKSIADRINIPPIIVDGAEEVFASIRACADPIAAAKKRLYLTENRGGFIRKCPGTRNYTCCDYMILHVGTFCIMDCAYCILQSYFHPPVLQYFVNHQQMFEELDTFLAERHHRRIGTGEYTDSMIWELWSDLSAHLIPVFAGQSHAVLELKTKTTHIQKLKGLPHNRRTIVSWSMNTPAIIRRNERGTASLDARLEAAAKCQKWGYPLGFHFDPIVDYSGALHDYQMVVDRIFDRIHPENIVWISLGTLRFMPDLKAVVQSRFPESKMIYGEFISGLDGKERYLKQIRTDIYSGLVEAIRKRSREVTVYFCMESEEVWRKVFGFTSDQMGGLSHMLDESAVNKCHLRPS
jgi:spore photoproduct lyase